MLSVEVDIQHISAQFFFFCETALLTAYRFCFNGVLEKRHKRDRKDTQNTQRIREKKRVQVKLCNNAETAEMSATQQHGERLAALYEVCLLSVFCPPLWSSRQLDRHYLSLFTRTK